jgi:acyl carrier protein
MLTPPNQSEILERLQKIVSGRVPVDPARFLPDAQLAEIGIDSFSLIELVFLAEEEFDIRIPIEGLSVSTVNDVLKIITARVESNNTC